MIAALLFASVACTTDIRLLSDAGNFNPSPQIAELMAGHKYARFIFTRAHPDFGPDTSWADFYVPVRLPDSAWGWEKAGQLMIRVNYYNFNGWTDYPAMFRQASAAAHSTQTKQGEPMTD